MVEQDVLAPQTMVEQDVPHTMVEQDVPHTMVEQDNLAPHTMVEQDVLALARPTVVETSVTWRWNVPTSEVGHHPTSAAGGFDTPRRYAPHRLNQQKPMVEQDVLAPQTMVEQVVPHTMVEQDVLAQRGRPSVETSATSRRKPLTPERITSRHQPPEVSTRLVAPHTMVDFDKLNPTDQDVLAQRGRLSVETSATFKQSGGSATAGSGVIRPRTGKR
ncbi:hypothetical protein [Gordonia sp. NB41Y]|uniref:hypothetical protein n=1 Tax=Gordonia sp. NB41Y TaxID=875808 RepID=UPI00273C6503|nr:hypothetical protein [Gordonia sp. NB41Y]WLP91410.1 hypothetical protein Q9K23_03855 [Gordonia sp. NB41Y]